MECGSKHPHRALSRVDLASIILNSRKARSVNVLRRAGRGSVDYPMNYRNALGRALGLHHFQHLSSEAWLLSNIHAVIPYPMVHS